MDLIGPVWIAESPEARADRLAGQPMLGKWLNKDGSEMTREQINAVYERLERDGKYYVIHPIATSAL